MPWCDVHVGDAHVPSVNFEVEIFAWVGIRTLVTGDAARLDVGGQHRSILKLGTFVVAPAAGSLALDKSGVRTWISPSRTIIKS